MSYKAEEFAVEQSVSDLLYLVDSQERPVPLPEKILVPPKRKWHTPVFSWRCCYSFDLEVFFFSKLFRKTEHMVEQCKRRFPILSLYLLSLSLERPVTRASFDENFVVTYLSGDFHCKCNQPCKQTTNSRQFCGHSSQRTCWVLLATGLEQTRWRDCLACL